MKDRLPIIAIDGPVGSGKTTTARLVAKKLGFSYVDTGAMYRAVTLAVLQDKVDLSDRAKVADVVKRSVITLEFEDGQKTFLNGVDVSERIRSLDVTRAVSAVSAMEEVRAKMTEIQRNIGKMGGIVMEGRDIGTVVFPDAEFKVYLDASLEVRTERRLKELETKGIIIPREQLMKDIVERDRANMERDIAPLKKAPESIIIDTSNMSLNEQVEAVVNLVLEEEK